MSDDTRQGYRPCSVCGHYGSEWRLINGTRYAVTAPRGVSVEKGESWTCTICVEQGHEQRANQSSEREPTLG
jgi:hypothetical protein